MADKGIAILFFLSLAYINGTVIHDNDFNHWAATVTALEQRVANLEGKISVKDDRIKQLEEKIITESERKDFEISQLREGTKRLQQTTDFLRQYILEFKDGIIQKPNANVEEITGPVEANRYKRDVSAPPVAFHTRLSSSMALLKGHTMIFDENVLDQGNGYNSRDGIYTAPESGTYVFSWKVLSRMHTVIYTSLVVNGEVMDTSDVDSEDITDYHQATAMVVVALTEGDDVSIQVTGANKNAGVISDSSHGKATFSGWKI